jgi:protein involved in polysaccharide export with SLBB domain
MKFLNRIAIACHAAVLLLSTTTATSVGWVRSAAAQTQPPVHDAVVSTDDSSGTALRPGDMLRLKIWREPDLSGDFTVTEPGVVTLPRLGVLSVTGVPVAQLQAQVIAGYRGYLRNPSIEVIPLRRVSIIGAVRSPGMYSVDPSIAVGQVVNLAGGTAPEAQRGKLELRRNGQRIMIDLNSESGVAAMPLISGDEVYVPGRSWFARNGTWFVSTLLGLGTSVALIATQ